MTHWAARYIGRPHVKDSGHHGEGPDAFSCWGLMRVVFREHDGIDLPLINIGADCGLEAQRENVRLLHASAAPMRWRRLHTINQQPIDGDIVQLTSAISVHVGRVTRANHKLGVLHCESARGVVFDDWQDACYGMKPEIWRRER